METKTDKTQLGYVLEHVSSLLIKQGDQILLEQLGIGYAQFKIMHVLKEHSAVGQRHIAQELGQTEAGISRQIKLLQEDGFVRARIDPTNRRQHRVRLTRKGHRFTHAAEELLERYQQTMFEPLKPKEKFALQQALARIHDQAHAPTSHIPKNYKELLHQL